MGVSEGRGRALSVFTLNPPGPAEQFNQQSAERAGGKHGNRRRCEKALSTGNQRQDFFSEKLRLDGAVAVTVTHVIPHPGYVSAEKCSKIEETFEAAAFCRAA